MLLPVVTGKLKGGPGADHVLQQHSSWFLRQFGAQLVLLEKEMNGMFLGSATPYLPL